MSGKLHRCAICALRAIAAIAAIAALAPPAARAAPVSLPAYAIDITQTSVSGLSAGAYMAVQMHIVHSSIMQGAGVFAGGPYHCAEGSALIAQTRCMQPNILFPAPSASDVARYARVTRERAAAGLVDDPANLARQKVWIFVGTRDDVVRPVVAASLRSYYAHFMGPSNIVFRNELDTFHNQVVLEGDARVHSCTYKNNAVRHDAYVNDCDYDAAGDLLRHIYGTLAPRNGGVLSGNFIEFDQHAFLAGPRSHGMDDTGWAYIPASCAAGTRCRLHVAFHGCFQYAEHVQDAYVRNSGLNQWADTNELIVLYPQTVRIAQRNPNGCFDWWGYTSPRAYDTRDGIQIAAIRRMIERLARPREGGDSVLAFASDAAFDGYVKARADGGAAEVGVFSSLAVGRGSDGKLNRALLSFDTSAIPAGATITRAFLRLTHRRTFRRPWSDATAGPIRIDVARGVFGVRAATEPADWPAAPTIAAAASMGRFDGGPWRSGEFSAAGLDAIGRGPAAVTQLRLGFSDRQATPGYVRIEEGAGATLTVAYR